MEGERYSKLEFIKLLVKRGIVQYESIAKSFEKKMGKAEYTEEDFIEVYRKQEYCIRSHSIFPHACDGQNMVAPSHMRNSEPDYSRAIINMEYGRMDAEERKWRENNG